MKKYIFLTLMTLLCMSFVEKEPKFPQGAWKQCSKELYIDDKLVEKEIINYYSMKIFSENKWEFIHKIPTESITFYEYGAGSYKLNGKEYSETIEIHVSKNYEGQTINMMLEFINDTLIQTWNPIDSNGILNTKTKYIEKFVRLK